jgi:hypothetical protein
MKRMHVHVSVEDIGKAVGFYSALFATKPAVVHAKACCAPQPKASASACCEA